MDEHAAAGAVPGPLIGAGRSADIYDIGDGRVLRRRRGGTVPGHEVAAMRAAHAAGYPAPAIYEVDGSDMVMDRVDGHDMLGSLVEKPWRIVSTARSLAELHRRLLDVPIDGLDIRTVHGDREALVHNDLHPGNVLATADGPVVIDWEGAGVGPRDADVATTWLLMTVGEVDDLSPILRMAVSTVRKILIRIFLAGVDRPRPETIRAVCEARLADANLRDAEKERIREFAGRHGTGGAPVDRP